MDANCPPGRARPRNVVARGQVADILCVVAGEKVCFRASFVLAPRWQDDRMSAMGHEQTSRHVRVMPVIPLKADIHQRGLQTVPQADITCARKL